MKLNLELLDEHTPVIAGVSGGADSVCLLLLLKKESERLGFPLYACHVEHGIRGEESLGDMAFVRELCEREEVGLYTEQVDVPEYAKSHAMGIEEAARILRRRVYCRAAEHFASGGKVSIALGHHAGDNAETILLNLIRGTGLKGLAGMSPRAAVRDAGVSSGEIYIIRPLLKSTGQEIIDWLNKRGQHWRTDSTNQDLIYTRNKLRHGIIPLLEEINPMAVSHINAAGVSVAEVLSSGADEIRSRYDSLRTSRGLDVRALRRLTDSQRRSIYGIWIGENGGLKDITQRHYAAIDGLVFKGTGKGIDLPGKRRALREYDILLIEKRYDEGDPASKLHESLQIPDIGEKLYYDFDYYTIVLSAFNISPESTIPKKSYAKWFDYDTIDSIVLRNPMQGDHIAIDSFGRKKALRRLFIDKKVPRAERNRIPVLAREGSDVIWAIGVRESMAYHISFNTKRVLEISVNY